MADHHRASAAEPGLSPDAAYARWMDVCTDAGWRCVPAAEQIPVRDGLGRMTAATIQALRPAPRAACAAMDGIAIRAASAAADSAAADSAAADSAPGPRRIAASAFAWIDTGDPLPAGMDTVVERERVRIDADGSAWITGPAPRGRHVRPVGEDFQAGEMLVPSGRRLRPADLAAAVAAGHTTLEVTRKPVIAIIPTGDEIQPIGSELGPGDVVDSNSVLLAARAGQVGARPLVCDVQPDDADAIAAEVRRASLAADLVLVIAGSSVGRDDHTAAVLTHVGGLAVSKVAVRPGHPVLLGYALPRRTSADRPVAPVPVIGIPGYPLAAAVSFELFAIPLLAALQGREPADRAWRRVQLGADWTSPPHLEEWVPVSLTAPSGPHDSTAVVATPSKGGAGAISRLARAGAWWPIPVGQEKFERGAHIDVQPMSPDLLLPGTEPVRDRRGPAAVGHAELGQDAGHVHGDGPGLMNSASAIWRLVRPSAISVRYEDADGRGRRDAWRCDPFVLEARRPVYLEDAPPGCWSCRFMCHASMIGCWARWWARRRRVAAGSRC